MPAQQQDSRNHQARRVFRGRGGPTDGRLPPKKTTRPRVKYQHQPNVAEGGEPAAEEGARQLGSACGDAAESGGENDVRSYDAVDESDMQKLSLDDDGADNAPEDEVLREINHLRRRIQNVQSSLQTSQGLSDPKKWRTNCLFPVRNAVKEWRSILLYHFAECQHEVVANDEQDANANGTEVDENRDLLHATAQEVFGLIQMSLQTGPLVGSNPGYFKRCGGEVASVAFQFLTELAELAEVDVQDNESNDGKDSNASVDDACDRGQDATASGATPAENVEDANICSNSSGSDSDHDEQSESESSCGSTPESVGIEPESENADDTTWPKEQMLSNLQSTLLFTEKQSQRFCQWLRNAEKAAEQNKPPSKSARKLQGQKSKKQRQKELKMERKLKKKKKGGG